SPANPFIISQLKLKKIKKHWQPLSSFSNIEKEVYSNEERSFLLIHGINFLSRRMIEVSVVIPIYKSELTDSELKSFKQCLDVLGNHPLMLVAPTGLDTSTYETLAGRNLQCTYFNKRYFTSVRGYSELLLSKKFYCHFEAYEYILIYQLDAWVFQDDLSHWCKLDYDYIGAP